MLRSDLCDYFDPYIVIKGTITVEGANYINKHNRSLILKDYPPFISCISKINGILIDNAEDRCCNNCAQSDGVQQKLFKDIRQFMDLLQRYFN